MGETAQVALDDAGRISIPEPIRSRLGLRPGSQVLIESHGDREALLRSLDEAPAIVDEGGVLVVECEAVGDLADVVRDEREARSLVRPQGLP